MDTAEIDQITAAPSLGAPAPAHLRRKVSFAVAEPKAGEDAPPSASKTPRRPRPVPVSSARRRAAKKKQTAKGWVRKMITWWTIREPSAPALERYRITQFRKVGLPPDASCEEATYRLHAPIGKIPDDAVKAVGGPTPEEVYMKKLAERQRKRKESVSGESQGSGSSRRAGSSRAKGVDPKKLLVAPWLAEEGPAEDTQAPRQGSSSSSSHHRVGSSREGKKKVDPKKLLVAPWLAEE